MKKIILLLFVGLSNASEYKFNQYYNSLKSHYDIHDQILIFNNTKKSICVFNETSFFTEEGIKFYYIGIVITPKNKTIIDLCNIASINKIQNFRVYEYKKFLSLVKGHQSTIYLDAPFSKIKVGKKYKIEESDSKLFITKY